ncbi:MAG: preprotein translocase subunit SecD, partial [Actinomycetota bacterium]|nr:preprotein translocase subunit SecD [Actinomycetota bacterium]
MPPAKRTSPGRPLVVVVLLLAVLYGWMALGGRYSPALGLDLRGGTTVTLTPVALDGAKIRSSDIATTKTILEKRVNGLGVGNAEVKTEGSNIVVSVPGKDTQGALKDIGKTALLSIRQVYETNQPVSGGTDVPDTSSPSVTTSISPAATPSSSSSSTPSTSPSSSVSPSGSATSPKALGQDSSGAQAQPAAFHRADSSSPSAGASTPAASPAASASPSPSASATSAAADVNPTTPETTPTAEELAAYAKLDCSVPANQQGGARKDLPNKFLVTCGNPDASPIYHKYLLHPTLIAGKDVSTAAAALDSPT